MRAVGWQAGVLTVPWAGRLAFSRVKHTAAGCCGNRDAKQSSAAMHTCKQADSDDACQCFLATQLQSMYSKLCRWAAHRPAMIVNAALLY